MTKETIMNVNITLNKEESEMFRDEVAQQFEIHQSNIDDHYQKINVLTDEELDSFRSFRRMYVRMYLELIYQGVSRLPNHSINNFLLHGGFNNVD